VTLFLAFSLVVVPICVLGLYSRSLRLSVALVAVILAASYWGGSELLGRPKPARLSWFASATLVAADYRENVAIWVWLRQPGETAPRAYVLPWSLDVARKIRQSQRRAEQDGTTVGVTRKKDGHGEFSFYAQPQPAMPPKE